MRCLQCGKRLPLFRKVDGDFCSAAHAAEYAAREQTAAIARLKQATQQEVKSRSVWERRRKLKNGDVAPAEMRGLVSLSLPNAISYRTFQRVVANPRPIAIPPMLPAIDRDRVARIPKPDSLISDLLDPVEPDTIAAVETLEPMIEAPAPRWAGSGLTVAAIRFEEALAESESPIAAATAGGDESTIVEPACEPAPEISVVEAVEAPLAEEPLVEVAVEAAPLQEPEMVAARLEQLKIGDPDPRRIPVRIRRPYAQSTPLRPGRKPIVLARLNTQPVPYESCDPVREPAGLVALGFGAPRTVPAGAIRQIEDPAAPPRSQREFGHPVRLSALALLHTAVGLAALDGVLQPNPGVARPAIPLPEAAPVRAPGKLPPPAFSPGSRAPVPLRGLNGAGLVPIAPPRASRTIVAGSVGLLEAAPFVAARAVLPGLRTAGASPVSITASSRLEPIPESQYPQPRSAPALAAPIPVEPEGPAGTQASKGAGPYLPPKVPRTAFHPVLFGLDAPEPARPRVAVVRRPDAVPVATEVAVVEPSLPVSTGLNIAPAAGRVPIVEPAPLPAPLQAHTPAPARVESQTGLAIIAAPVQPTEIVPPVAGPVPIEFDVRAAAGSLAVGYYPLNLLPPDLETSLPQFETRPAEVNVASGERRPDGRQQARGQTKAKSAFAETQAKPQPAFGKAGKQATRRYVPVMTPARPAAARPGTASGEGRGDPPMASRVGIYAIVPAVRGTLEPRAIETDLTWRKRRQTAGIRYEPTIDKIDWVNPGRPDRLKPPGTFAEKNGGARFNLIDEIGVPEGLWQSIRRRWKASPAAVRWSVPAVLLVGLVAALPLRRGEITPNSAVDTPDMSPPAATMVTRPAPPKNGTAVEGKAPSPVSAQAAKRRAPESGWRARLRSRAAIVLVDDFRAGLGEWMGDGNWARGWAYDLAGFVRPGALGIYTPTVEMTDYQMELLGQIDRRSLGWIVRAADARNYYAMKLVVAEPGPVPKVVLERYAVVRGVPGAVHRKNLHFTVRNDTSYRILTEVHGNDYAVAVQGSLVDSWTETRLDRGGVGLFSTGGDQARIRWISVTHQDDLLGKLCAFFAPPSLGRDRGANE